MASGRDVGPNIAAVRNSWQAKNRRLLLHTEYNKKDSNIQTQPRIYYCCWDLDPSNTRIPPGKERKSGTQPYNNRCE